MLWVPVPHWGLGIWNLWVSTGLLNPENLNTTNAGVISYEYYAFLKLFSRISPLPFLYLTQVCGEIWSGQGSQGKGHSSQS